MVFDSGNDIMCQRHDPRWEYASGVNNTEIQNIINSQRFEPVISEKIMDGGGGPPDVAVFVTDTSGKIDGNGGILSASDIIIITDSSEKKDMKAIDIEGQLNVMVHPSLNATDRGGGDGGDGDGARTPGMASGCSRVSLISVEKNRRGYRDETWLTILSQIGFPFLIAGMGMVGAGLLLDYVMTWDVYEAVPELVILVTPLLGLKGDLEMTLASRLSTHAYVGNLDDKEKRWKICTGNLCLDQTQAIVCGLVAAFIAIITGLITDGRFDFNHVLLLCSASIITASLVSIFLGSIMVSVILFARKNNLNPDNIATPVAGSLGDVVTLAALSYSARLIYQGLEIWIGFPFLIMAFYAIVVPFCAWKTYQNEYTKEVLINGWVPVIVSVLISTGGGVILDQATERHPGIALYQPVINGIGGNLVSVQASRISSHLHKDCVRGTLPNNAPVFESPWTVFCTKGIHSMSARVLLLMAIPGHLVFATSAHFISGSENRVIFDALFLAVYIGAAVCQIALLLYIAKLLTNFCWRRKADPDTTTIPYLTAFGDLFGSSFLLLGFEILKWIR